MYVKNLLGKVDKVGTEAPVVSIKAKNSNYVKQAG